MRTTLVVALALTVGIVAQAGCGLTPTDAREQLTAIGVEYSPYGFMVAARDNDLRAVELFIVAGMDLDVEVPGIPTSVFALGVAAQEGHDDVVKLLIEAGAADLDGSVIANYAGRGNLEITGMLLDAESYSVRLLSLDDDEDHPYDLAVARASARGRTEVLRMLLDAGAVPDYGTSVAARRGHAEGLRILLDAGADGGQMFTTTIFDGNFDRLHPDALVAVETFIEAGGNVNMAVPNMDSPLRAVQQASCRGLWFGFGNFGSRDCRQLQQVLIELLVSHGAVE